MQHQSVTRSTPQLRLVLLLTYFSANSSFIPFTSLLTCPGDHYGLELLLTSFKNKNQILKSFKLFKTASSSSSSSNKSKLELIYFSLVFVLLFGILLILNSSSTTGFLFFPITKVSKLYYFPISGFKAFGLTVFYTLSTTLGAGSIILM